MKLDRHSPLREARPETGNDGGLIPLINVVFLVLVFLLMAGTIAPVDALRTAPPESGTADKRNQVKLNFTISADGTLWWQEHAVAVAGLDDVLAEIRNTGKSTSSMVEIRADRAAPSGVLQILLSALQAAGFQEVRLVTAVRAS